ncbi:DUF6221 family protein [Streptomyces sp. NPDC052535]|uniref:DUF6221 family protein n=1 Tax=Streptomyces sp. NPDC052535 TaxID=3155531 RepID=UPI003428789A
MTAQGGDILAWLETAITRREETARTVGYGRIETGEYLWVSRYLILLDGPNGESKVTTEMPAELAEHIAANDPESVLRRCAADRKLLELHGGRGHGCPAYDYDGDLDEFARFYNHEACPVVQHLAESYGWTAGQTPPTEGDQVT